VDLAFGAPLRITEVKAAGDAWEVSGYASTYDRDLGDDVVIPGAFQKSLTAGRPVRFLYSHDPSQVLGTVQELKEDEKGLFGRFKISQTALGKDVHTLLKDGALDSFSIGYLPTDFEHDRKAGVRKLTEVELLEVSVVAMPMNPAAVVTGVKALDGVALQQAMSAYVADAEARKRAEAVERPIEAILDDALRAVKALCERRRADGREPSERTVAAVGAYRDALLKSAADLAAAVVGEPVDEAPEALEPPEAKAEDGKGEAADPTTALAGAGLVERHQRRKRISALIAKYREKDEAA
jgi:HK97 family phage prohead protease